MRRSRPGRRAGVLFVGRSPQPSKQPSALSRRFATVSPMRHSGEKTTPAPAGVLFVAIVCAASACSGRWSASQRSAAASLKSCPGFGRGFLSPLPAPGALAPVTRGRAPLDQSNQGDQHQQNRGREHNQRGPKRGIRYHVGGGPYLPACFAGRLIFLSRLLANPESTSAKN